MSTTRQCRTGVAVMLIMMVALIHNSRIVSAFMCPSRSALLTNTATATSSTPLSMSSPPPRKPRRELKKRRRRDDNKRRFIPAKGGNKESSNPFAKNDNTNTEYRPLVPSVRRDLGEDYWIDPEDLEKEQQREQAELARLKRRKKGGKDAISKDKLWDEVKAPYQQNWIGYFSVFIAILSMIVLKFPELLETPNISYPDL